MLQMLQTLYQKMNTDNGIHILDFDDFKNYRFFLLVLTIFNTIASI